MGRTLSDKKFDLFSQIVALIELRLTKNSKPTNAIREVIANNAYEASELYLKVFQRRDFSEKKKVLTSSGDKITASIHFNRARELYPGTKRGNDTEFLDFSKKHKDFLKVAPLIERAVKRQIEYRKYKKNYTQEFVPPWANFRTWIFQRRWEEYIPDVPIIKSNSEIPL